MKNKIITAVSFFYEGERHVVKCTTTGKFRVPVTEVIEGRVRTKNKSLTAKQLGFLFATFPLEKQQEIYAKLPYNKRRFDTRFI